MEIGSVVIVILIFFLSGLFILRPFLLGTDTKGRAGTTLRDSLIADRERLLHAIEEIDLEYDLKKISSEEHAKNRNILLSEAAKVIKELDNLPQKGKAKQKKTAAGKEEGDLEKMIADRRKQLQSKKSKICPHCGESVDKSAKFCNHCGGAL